MPEEVAPAEVAPATTETTQTADLSTTASSEATPDPFDNAETQQFERAYVEKVRGEAAKYRTEHKPFKEAFDGWADDDRSTLLNVVNLLKVDPAAGAEALRQIADIVSPAELKEIKKEIKDAADADPADPADAEDPDAGLSVDEIVERKLAEREVAAEQKRSIDSVIAQAAELGYPAGTPDHITLLWVANNQTNGDMKEAAKVLDARNDKIVEAYITKKQAANETFVTPTSGSVSAQQNSTEKKTFASARAAVEARIAGVNTPA